jgi:hypothetical protein
MKVPECDRSGRTGGATGTAGDLGGESDAALGVAEAESVKRFYCNFKGSKKMPIKMLLRRLAMTSYTLLIFNICPSVESQSSRTTLLKSISCQTENMWASVSSRVSTYVQFINRRTSAVKVYWIDFDGKRQHYFDLEPSESREQQTYVSHPWLITDSGANQPCINIFLPSESKGIAIID